MRGIACVLVVSGLIGLAEGQVAARRWSADRGPGAAGSRPSVWVERGWRAPTPVQPPMTGQVPQGPGVVGSPGGVVVIVVPGGVARHGGAAGAVGGHELVQKPGTPVFDAVKSDSIRQPVPVPDASAFRRSGRVSDCVRRWQHLMYRTGLVYDCRGWRAGVIAGPAGPIIVDEMPEPEVELPPEKIETLLDAMVAIGEERVDEAALALGELVRAHPEEPRFRRLLGLALLETGELDRGIEAIATAYGMDPGLSDEPIESLMYESRPRRLRELTVDVVRLANRRTSAEAWLTVAVLMQGEGRETHALRMVAKAEHEGLDPVLAGLLESALGPRP